jgi:hypothetical protein
MLAHELGGGRILRVVVEHRTHEAEVDDGRTLAQQIGALGQDGLELLERGQRRTLHVGARLVGDAVVQHEASVLTFGDHPLLQEARHTRGGHQLVREHAARVLAVQRVAPAVVHGRAPEPLVGVVLEQQREKAHRRILGIDRGPFALRLEPGEDGRRIREPAPVFELHHRALHGARARADLARVVDHREQLERVAAVAQVRLELSVVVGDAGAEDAVHGVTRGGGGCRCRGRR